MLGLDDAIGRMFGPFLFLSKFQRTPPLLAHFAITAPIFSFYSPCTECEMWVQKDTVNKISQKEKSQRKKRRAIRREKLEIINEGEKLRLLSKRPSTRWLLRRGVKIKNAFLIEIISSISQFLDFGTQACQTCPDR